MATVKECADKLGWIAVHFPEALCNPSGWPDLILIRGRRTIFAELKREQERGKKDGGLGPKQVEWIGCLEHIGAEIYVWYPSDWDEIEMTLRGES